MDHSVLSRPVRRHSIEGPNQQRESVIPGTPAIAAAGMSAGQKLLQEVQTYMQDEGPEYKGRIRNYADFMRQKEAFMKLNDVPVRESGDRAKAFPEGDDEAQRGLVEELHDAMGDFKSATHATRTLPVSQRPALKKRKRGTGEASDAEAADDGRPVEVDSHAVARVKKLASYPKEHLCWDLLIATRDAQRGQWSIPPWCPDRKKRTYTSFRARFDHVLQAIRENKNIVKSLATVEFAKRLAADPKGEISFTRSNNKTNDKRKNNKVGKTATPTGSSSTLTRQEAASPINLANLDDPEDDERVEDEVMSGSQMNCRAAGRALLDGPLLQYPHVANGSTSEAHQSNTPRTLIEFGGDGGIPHNRTEYPQSITGNEPMLGHRNHTRMGMPAQGKLTQNEATRIDQPIFAQYREVGQEMDYGATTSPVQQRIPSGNQIMMTDEEFAEFLCSIQPGMVGY